MKLLSLAQKIRRKTLAKVFPSLLVLFVLIIAVDFYYLQIQIDQQQKNEFKEFKEFFNTEINNLNSQIKSLSENDLIINSIVDDANRDDYLPVFFRSIKPVGSRINKDQFSISFTDFEGDIITSSDDKEFNTASKNYDWVSTVFDQQKSFQMINHHGVFIAYPVLYGTSAEGAIVLHIKDLKAVLPYQSNKFGVLVSDSGKVLINALPKLASFSLQTVSNLENLVGDELRSALSDLVSAQHWQGDLSVTTYASHANAYQDLWWVLIISIVAGLIVLAGTILSIQLASNTASKIILTLQTRISEAHEDGGNFKDIEAYENESIETSELRTSFNSLMSRLLNVTLFKDQIEGVINSFDELLVVYSTDQLVLIKNDRLTQFCEDLEVSVDKSFTELFALDFVGNNDEIRTFENTYENAQGDSFVISWTRTLYKNQKGELIGYVLAGIDITDAKNMQEDLNLKDQAIEAAVNSIVISDARLEGVPIIYANKSFTSLTGYSNEETLGRSCNFLQGRGTDPKSITKIRHAIRMEKPVNVTILNYRKDGTPFYNDLAINPIVDEDGNVTHFMGIQTDVTKREETAALLLEAKNAAEESAKLKSEFLASMSHEIRTPMNGILGMLGLLSKSTLNKQQRHHTRLAKSSADSLLSLINDILDFSKIEAGKLEIEKVQLDVVNVLCEVCESVAPNASEKGLETIIDVSQISHRQVEGDPGRIRQILVNLLGNAIKFTRRGSITLEASLETVSAQNTILVCKVKDTGVGIPEDRVDKIFESFSQVDASTTREFGGTGLGLSISTQLAKLMDGEVSVESVLGTGSTFTLRIPLTLSGAVDNSSQNQASGLRIVIADPNQGICDAVEKQLLVWDAKTTICTSDNQLMKELRSNEFDLLLLNTEISDADTKDFINRVLETAQHNTMKLSLIMPLALLTEAEDIIGSRDISYIAKPVTPNELSDAIQIVRKLGTGDNDDINASESTQDPEAIHENLQGKQVLLVEDNAINQMLAVTLLEDLGLAVDVANHGIEALEILKASHGVKTYDLILMDCQMPQMDGFEATHNIRQGKGGNDYQSTPIIAMTANAMQGDKERCLDSGMDDYISKPVDTAILEQKLNEWLTHKVHK